MDKKTEPIYEAIARLRQYSPQPEHSYLQLQQEVNRLQQTTQMNKTQETHF
jgi:hypothetical protein